MKPTKSIILIILGTVFCGLLLGSAYGAVPTSAPGSISGRVYDNATGTGIPEVTLLASNLSIPCVRGARSGGGGYYEITGLRPGNYTLRADPNSIPGDSNYAIQYYNQKDTEGAADLVPDTSSGIDFPLIPKEESWAITGRAFDFDTGEGISGISVTATGPLGTGATTTDSQGNYTLPQLPSGGQYRLFARTGDMIDQPLYASQYYNQQDIFETADWVSHSDAGIDFPLKKGGVITGRIQDKDTGAGIPDITVNAYSAAAVIVSFDHTDEDGFYSIRPFPTGDYRLEANTGNFNYWHAPACYMSRWYDNGAAFSNATAVSAVLNQTTVVGDWFLAPCPGPTPIPTPFEKIILISQFSTYGLDSPDETYRDNFVELYNTSQIDVSLAGWSLWYMRSDGTHIEKLLTIPAVDMIHAESYFLLARDWYYDGPEPDYTWSIDVALWDAGATVWLEDAQGQQVDMVGWGDAQNYLGSAAPVQEAVGGSVIRKVSERSTAASMSPGGVEYGFASAYNSDNNGNDFLNIYPRRPRNSVSGSQPPFPGLPPLNPSFEESPDLVDWTIVGDPARISKSSVAAYEGSYSCKFNAPTASYADRGIRSNVGGASAGAYYDFSGYFYVKDSGQLQPITATKLQFLIEWLDSDKNTISTSGGDDLTNASFDTWEKHRYLNVEAPAGTMYVRLYLACKEDAAWDKNNDVFIDYFISTKHIETPEIVISQLAPKGPQGYSDGFVEIYNYGSGNANLSGCTLNYMRADGSDPEVVVSIPEGTIMPANTYFLFGQEYWYNNFATVKADLTWDTTSLWSHGGNVWMANTIGQKIDLVGWGDSQFAEGDNPIPEQPVDDSSFKRKVSSWSTEASISPGGSEYRFGNAYDTQNNGDDFLTVSPRDPRNSTHVPVSPFPTPPVTPTPAPAILSNPSFEEDPELVNWNKVGTAAEVTRSDTYAYDETYSCKFSAPTTDYADHGIRSDGAPANPGSAYEFSGYFYVPFAGGGSESDSKLQYSIEWRDSGDAVISTDGSSDWSVSFFNVWEEKKYEDVIAPAGTATVTIYLAGRNNPASTSDIYLDYFSIVETAAAASPTPTAYLITPTPTPYVATPTVTPYIATPTPTVYIATPTPTAHTLPHIYLSNGDYNGDTSADIAVFRPSSGLWAIRYFTRCYFGEEGDIPVSGDYDGDGSSDIAVYRPAQGLWGIYKQSRIYFGQPEDIPVPGDYNGGGTCLPAIFRPALGAWRIREFSTVYFGGPGDIPVPADYSGSGICWPAIYRPAFGMWALKDSSRIYFGGGGDLPQPGDYDGDGSSNIAVFKAKLGLWAVRDDSRHYFGREGDLPVPADFNGDGAAQITIFRPATGAWHIKSPGGTIYFGSDQDQPVTR